MAILQCERTEHVKLLRVKSGGNEKQGRGWGWGMQSWSKQDTTTSI